MIWWDVVIQVWLFCRLRPSIVFAAVRPGSWDQVSILNVHTPLPSFLAITVSYFTRVCYGIGRSRYNKSALACYTQHTSSYFIDMNICIPFSSSRHIFSFSIFITEDIYFHDYISAHVMFSVCPSLALCRVRDISSLALAKALMHASLQYIIIVMPSFHHISPVFPVMKNIEIGDISDNICFTYYFIYTYTFILFSSFIGISFSSYRMPFLHRWRIVRYCLHFHALYISLQRHRCFIIISHYILLVARAILLHFSQCIFIIRRCVITSYYNILLQVIMRWQSRGT